MKIGFLLFLFIFSSQLIVGQETKSPISREQRQEIHRRLIEERADYESELQAKRDSMLDLKWSKTKRNQCSIFPSMYAELGKVYHAERQFELGVLASYEYRLFRNVGIYIPSFISMCSEYKSIGLGLKLSVNTLRLVQISLVPLYFLGTDKIEDYYYDEYGFTWWQKGRRYTNSFQLNCNFGMNISKHMQVGWLFGPGVGKESYTFKHKPLTSIYEGVDSNPLFMLYAGMQVGYQF